MKNYNVENLLEKAEEAIEEECGMSSADYTLAEMAIDKVLEIEPNNAMAYLLKACIDLDTSLDCLGEYEGELLKNDNFSKAYRLSSGYDRKKIEDIIIENKESYFEYNEDEFKEMFLKFNTTCKNCRTKNFDDSNYCSHCGKPLK